MKRIVSLIGLALVCAAFLLMPLVIGCGGSLPSGSKCQGDCCKACDCCETCGCK